MGGSYWRGSILSLPQAENIISKTTTGFFIVGALMALVSLTSRGNMLPAIIFSGSSYMLQRTKHRNWAYALMFLPALAVVLTPITAAVAIFYNGEFGLGLAMFCLTVFWLIPLQATRRALSATIYINRQLNDA